ncbi:alpha/beta hydrolase family protein [Roseovarius sp. A-2]|uniref:alpha/beta hydrolase family esterase n=1 Tax=Roseovarius sp. A-2 TaxID=1570360 RepID=UPI0009B58F25|nr:polyhydroxybutyrate depolymerase [Roseovarius sp. A-2]GAW34046.1 alpha/beta hydrolase family protein [Roseovarius sp. A-2]
MRLIPFLLCLLWPVTVFASGPEHAACHAEVPCPLGARSYHVKEPDEWDGTSSLPVLLHFHGWMRQGTLIVKHGRISGATRRRGVLLLAPNGQGKTWDFWTDQTDDVAFASAVIEDAAKRYPIDRSRIYVSGYSYGSAMAWRYACESGNGVAALLAVSGTLRQDETCPEAPGEVRHVHGTSDTVMDFPFGPNGETTGPVRLWRARMGCSGAGQSVGEWSITEHDTFARTTWDCAEGRIALDVHGRGHFIPRGWIARQLDELLDLPRSYP